MSIKSGVFVNPDCLPVEHVTVEITNIGVLRKIKALDTYWVEEKELVNYERPPSGSTLELGAVDIWMSKMEVYLDILKWLLSLEYHRFWSTILYHPTCMDTLVSFLQEANPPYIPPHESKQVHNIYLDIRKRVLVVFSRLITNKESKTQWMTKEFMSEVLYDNFIFTIPILWDICLIYGLDNKQHVARLVGSVFKLQPKYETDIAAAIGFVNEAFKYIILQVNKDYDTTEPPNLPETFKGFSEIRRPTNSKLPDKITFIMLNDLVIHLLDTAMTLRVFAEVYPPSGHLLRKCYFINSVIQMYEYGIPKLYEKLQEVGDPMSVSYIEVEQRIDATRSEFIDMFKEVLAGYKNAIFAGEGSIGSHVEDYLTVLMDGLSEKLFIRDYHACCPVHEDIEMLRQVYPEIDPVKTDYILQAVYSNLEDPIPEHLLSNHDVYTTNGFYETDDEPQTKNTTDIKIPEDLKQDKLISEVKDILPHLGDGFILKCLEFYGFNPGRVINAVLEDNLDDSLRGLDKSLPIIPEDPLDKLYLKTGEARLNVFDGDEFDVRTRKLEDIDVSRIHLGKRKSKHKNFKQLLNDKSDVKTFAELYNKYSIISDDEAIYDDEYDDTGYDGVPPPVTDPTEVRRPFVTPRALRTKEERLEEDSEDEQEEEEGAAASSSKSRLDFCVNPEEMRARREAAYQAKRGKGHRPPPQPKSADVVGKPKGQGQEKEVLHNREKKEKHKSARANHSRRQGAQWKRSQGMMPS